MFRVTKGKEIELATYLNKPLHKVKIHCFFKGLVVAVKEINDEYWEVKEFIHKDDPSYEIWHDMLAKRGFRIIACKGLVRKKGSINWRM